MKINRQVKNISWYFGGTLVTALLGFISTPLLTRVLSKEIYAQYGMVITFATLLSTFIYFGQDEAFMRYYNKRNESLYRYIFRCMKLPLAACFIVMIVLLEPTHTIIRWVFESNITADTAYLIGFYIILLVLQRFLMLVARMEERAINYSVSNVATKAVFIMAIAVLLRETDYISFNWVIAALTSGVLVACFINIYAIARAKHTEVLAGDPVSDREMLKFGIPFAFSSTLFFIVPLIEKLIIRGMTGWDTLAIYTGAAIFITVMNMVKVTVNSMWIPYAYKHYSQEEQFKGVFHNVGISLTYMMLFILAMTILLRRWLVLILAKDYFDSYIIAPAILFGACYDVLAAVYTIGINIKKKTAYHTIIPIIQMGISCTILYVLLPILGLRATGISYLFSIVASRTVQILIAVHYYGTGRREGKFVLLVMAGTVASVVSLFAVSLKFDIICACAIIIAGYLISFREISATMKNGTATPSTEGQ